MQLVDMKCDPKDYPQAESCAPCAPQQPQYPYGLRIYLDDDSLDKLGLEKLPELGAELVIQARVQVVSKSESTDPNDEDGDNDRKSMDLQVVAMGFVGEKKDPAKVAKQMYPGND